MSFHLRTNKACRLDNLPLAGWIPLSCLEVSPSLTQLVIFINKLCGVQDRNIRVINIRLQSFFPYWVVEMAPARQKKMEALTVRLTAQQRYLEDHPRANPDIAQKKLNDYAKILQIERWAKVARQERSLSLEIDQEAWAHEAQLDGCYVIKTDVPGKTATADTIHLRYMALDELGSLRGVEITIGNTTCQQVPQPTGLSQIINRGRNNFTRCPAPQESPCSHQKNCHKNNI